MTTSNLMARKDDDEEVYTISELFAQESLPIGERIRVRGYLLAYPWVTSEQRRPRKPGERRENYLLWGVESAQMDSIAYLVPYTGPEQYVEVEQNQDLYYLSHPFVGDSWFKRMYWKYHGWRTPGPWHNLLGTYSRKFVQEAILLDQADIFDVLRRSDIGVWLGSAYVYKHLATVEGTLAECQMPRFRLRLKDLTVAVVYNDYRNDSPKYWVVSFP